MDIFVHLFREVANKQFYQNIQNIQNIKFEFEFCIEKFSRKMFIRHFAKYWMLLASIMHNMHYMFN